MSQRDRDLKKGGGVHFTKGCHLQLSPHIFSAFRVTKGECVCVCAILHPATSEVHCQEPLLATMPSRLSAFAPWLSPPALSVAVVPTACCSQHSHASRGHNALLCFKGFSERGNLHCDSAACLPSLCSENYFPFKFFCFF